MTTIYEINPDNRYNIFVWGRNIQITLRQSGNRIQERFIVDLDGISLEVSGSSKLEIKKLKEESDYFVSGLEPLEA